MRGGAPEAAANSEPANPRRSWSGFDKVLHWVSAALIAVLLLIGMLTALQILDLGWQFEVTQLHKSLGLTFLAIALARIVWRCAVRRPGHPASMRRHERIAANTMHALLYILTIAMPLSGWVMVSASPLKIPAVWFQAFTVPGLVQPNLETYLLARKAHFVLAIALIAAIALHVAAALKHHFIDRDAALRAMLPGRIPPD